MGVVAGLALVGVLPIKAADWCRGQLYSADALATLQLPDFKYSVKPASGVFYDPMQSGSGLSVDVFPVGAADYGFVTYYHYQPDGRPTWLNLIAPVQAATMAQYTVDGVPSTISAQWAETSGGQCFDCAYTGFPPVTYPPHGVRALTVRSGYQLDMPASGQAALREMRLGRALGDGNTMKALVESGDIWQVRWRRRDPNQGVIEAPSGWIRFAKRDPSQKWRYVPAQTTSCVDDGTGNPVPSRVPAWMNHSAAALNAIDQQYEAKCMSSTLPKPNTVDFCPFFVEGVVAGLSRNTFFIDPATQRFFLKEHCEGCTTGASFFRDNAAVVRTAEVVQSGADRLVIRQFSATDNIWLYEFELIRIPREVVSVFLPNYVPTAN